MCRSAFMQNVTSWAQADASVELQPVSILPELLSIFKKYVKRYPSWLLCHPYLFAGLLVAHDPIYSQISGDLACAVSHEDLPEFGGGVRHQHSEPSAIQREILSSRTGTG
jgi:hypothetical protein